MSFVSIAYGSASIVLPVPLCVTPENYFSQVLLTLKALAKPVAREEKASAGGRFFSG